MESEKLIGGGAISVAQLVRNARRLVETGFGRLWVTGEVIGFSRAASGHCYFSLKDEDAQIDCVLFSRYAEFSDLPRNGEKTEVLAVPTIFEARGRFQLRIEKIRRVGAGKLYEKFLRLKESLRQRGWFDESRKRPIPIWPRRIGVIASPGGAAIQDILKTLGRRMPSIPVVVYPAPAQGKDAAPRIASAISAASRRHECDVLILARGGGGMEDLWAFNEEEIAAAMVKSPIPIIAGIGHESDFTIADFTADFRAATPTAAAAAATPDRSECAARLKILARRLAAGAWSRHDSLSQRLDLARRALIHPRGIADDKTARLGDSQARFARAMAGIFRTESGRLSAMQSLLRARAPDESILAEKIAMLSRRLKSAADGELNRLSAIVDEKRAALTALNPKQVLARGYSVAQTADGESVRDSRHLKIGDNLRLIFSRGAANARVEQTSESLPIRRESC